MTRRTTFRSAGLLAAALSLALGCSRQAARTGGPTGPYHDLVAAAEGDRARVVHFDDQTFLGLELTALRSGYSTGSVDLTGAEALIVSGAYARHGGRPTKPGGLDVVVEADGRVLARTTPPLEPDVPWWSAELDLSEVPAGTATIGVDAELPVGHRVLLRELVVRREGRRRPSASSTPQILLISVDTLREDAIGAFGGPWATPALDRFAEGAEVWSPHYAGGAWTKPSHATMLTGYRGDTHQVLGPESVLPEGLPTLAERFRDGGLRTAGLVYDCKWLDPKWGFDDGFDEYRVVEWRTRRSARRVANWIARHRHEPFFLFYHSFEPHSDFRRLPYEAPGTTQASLEREFGVPGYGCDGDLCASSRLEAINRGEVEPVAREAEILLTTYGRGVAATDAALGELFDALRAMGAWHNLLIVLTSDHGESFLEHGRVLHGSMWNEVIRVPLIVKWPGGDRAGERRSLPSASIDIAPTVLRAAGLDPGDLPGVPLQTLSDPRPMYVYGGSRAVIDGRWKIITSGDLTRCLFTGDIEADPEESTDLTAKHPEVFQELRGIARRLTDLDRHLRARHAVAEQTGEAPTLTEAEREKLRALGYLQ